MRFLINGMKAKNSWIQTLILIALVGWSETLAQSVQSNGGVLLDRIAAIVNGEVITLSELKEATARMQLGSLQLGPPMENKAESPHNPIPQSMEWEALNLLIERKLQVQLAQKQGITVSSEEMEQALGDIKKKSGFGTDEDLKAALLQEHFSLDQYKNDLREQLMIMKLANREVKSSILLNENELQDYYQNHLDRYALPDEIHLHQILLRIPPSDPPEVQKEAVLTKARELVAQLRAGTDFKSLAQQESEGPEAKEGGDLGFVKKGQMLPSVEQAISGLSVGEVSDPVITPAGIHIFFVEEVKTRQNQPFEAVKGQVREDLFQERSAKLYGEWLQGLRDTAQVEIKF